MSVLKAICKLLKATGGFIVGLTGVLAWLNITPEMVGRAAYDVLYIALPIVTFAGGVMSGWGLTKLWADHRLRNASKEYDEAIKAAVSEKETTINELEKRPTRDDLDAAVRSENERMMKRIDELTGKLADAYREIDYLKSGGKVMTREQLASYISNLPDALKRRLRYIESHGGSVRERKDGELSTLKQQGIITSQPDDWTNGTYVWTIAPDVRSVIKSNRAILNS